MEKSENRFYREKAQMIDLGPWCLNVRIRSMLPYLVHDEDWTERRLAWDGQRIVDVTDDHIPDAEKMVEQSDIMATIDALERDWKGLMSKQFCPILRALAARIEGGR
jgi:hypothetical protein